MPETSNFFGLKNEAAILRTSIAATIAIAVLGVGFGLISGSVSVTFDGIYSLIDASMSLLSLAVVNLITSHTVSTKLSRRLNEHFSMGFWHLEPLVLALNGILLITAAIYAFINAVGSLLSGGHDFAFDWAIVYAIATVAVCATMAILETRANRRIGSEFLRLDIAAWTMSGGITAALLVAFGIGYAVQGTPWQWVSPYIDPAALALVCLIIIPLPIATIRQAMADIFLVTPTELKRKIDDIAQSFVDRLGFVSYRSYVAKIGRSKDIQLYFIVPPDAPPRPIAAWDALRDEIGDAIGDEGPDRWLTVVFTADPEWAD